MRLEDRQFVESVRGSQGRMTLDQRPIILSGAPRRNSGVDQRAPGDGQPVLHAPEKQGIANFFSGVHSINPLHVLISLVC